MEKLLRFSLEDPVSKCYDKIDKNTIQLKSGFIGLCAEVDRYFKLSFNIDLNKPVANYHTIDFVTIFPNLSGISNPLLEELRILYCEIRNINAHLFLNKPIYASSNLIACFSGIAKPQFDIVKHNELTMYGMLFFVTFLCQKYQLWPFLSECLKSCYFIDFTKKETSKMQTETQHFLQQFCGCGKPIHTNEKYDKFYLQYINDTCKRYMTKIIFALEKSILGWSFSSTKMPSFSYLLNKNSPFSTESEVKAELIRLRNCWFHGSNIFDKIFDETGTFSFSLEYIVSVFIKLKRIIQGDNNYDYVSQLIEQFGEKLINFYVLRIIEVSYKLLDKRLLTEDKVDSRIVDVNHAVSNFENAPDNYFEMAFALIDNERITYRVSAPKFLDFFPRTTETDLLTILKIKSDNNISIGEFRSNHQEVCIALVDLNSEYLNLINGYSPHELPFQKEVFYSSKICLRTVYIQEKTPQEE